MMSWHIRLGYNAQRQDEDEAWEKLKFLARKIASDPKRIEKEAWRIDPATCDEGECFVDGYAMNYADPFQIEIGGPGQGHPLTICEKDRQIIQWGSTGCDVKYTVRRAFIRLLIEEAHRERIEVCLNVG